MTACTQTGPFGVGTLVCVAGEHPQNPGGHAFSASSQPDWHDAEFCDD